MHNKKVRRLGLMILSTAMGAACVAAPAFASEMPATDVSSKAQGEESNTEQFQMLMQQYYRIPAAVRTLLADNGVTIQMADQQTVSDTRKRLELDSEEACVWIPELRLIEVSAAYPTAGIGHATGHALNSLLSMSSTSNFELVYKAEAESLPMTGAVAKISSADEYFAEAFNVYTVNPSLLQEKCPKTYAYMEAAVNQAAIVKNTAFIDTDGEDSGTAAQNQNEMPTAESLGTSWDTYNADEILKLPYINASDTARSTITCRDNVKSVFNGFLQLPSNVIRAFMAEGWTFEIVDSDELQALYDQYFNGQSADGVNSAVFIGLHKVYIKNGAASGSENTRYVLAYFIDQMYREKNDGMGASDTEAFQSIYQGEGKDWQSKHPGGTAMQYFASSVNNYLNNQAGYISSRPQTAAYVAAAINSMTENSASVDNLLAMYQTSPGYSVPQNPAGTDAGAENRQDTGAANTSQNVGNIGSTENAGAQAPQSVGIGFDPKLIPEPENQAKLAVVNEYWNKVPQPVREYLGSKNVGIIMEPPVVVAFRAAVTNNAEYDEHVVGLWLPDANAISVSYEMPEISVCHEAGHAFDEYTKVSRSPEFARLFATECGSLQSSGASNYAKSAEEYFGEAFNQYCLRKDLLKETCPQTYAYIDQMIASVA